LHAQKSSGPKVDATIKDTNKNKGTNGKMQEDHKACKFQKKSIISFFKQEIENTYSFVADPS
jgi:hypothetical protein